MTQCKQFTNFENKLRIVQTSDLASKHIFY